MAHQEKLMEDKDEFVESLNLTPEKIREDLENMLDLEGFPIGDIEDILELSDPPYYTAYPNPYIKDFIEMYGTPYDEEADDYDVEPFVGDVSEGKNDVIYMTHAYSTKVPYKAIKKFIEHYTDPGDIVFDGFCGTGMTGIAAMATKRYSILNDLSTLASFITANFNKKVDIERFYDINLLMDTLEKEVRWMYETKHNNEFGIINSTIWSDVFYCPHCNREFIFWDLAVIDGKIHKDLKCECGAEFKKNQCEKVFFEYYDLSLDKKIRLAKQAPVQINYTYKKKRFTKKPDSYDLELLKKIDDTSIPYWHPITKLIKGYNTKQPIKSHGYTHVHHFYTKRNVYTLSYLFKMLKEYSIPKKFIFTSILPLISKMYRYRSSGKGGSISNALYIPSLSIEQSPFIPFKSKYNQIIKSENLINEFFDLRNIISNQSSTNLSNIPSNTIDYIFVDPPFGSNIMYSELNFLAEAWLKVFTNNEDEAIINNVQNKGPLDYKKLMIESFEEFFNVLKPNRWITVEFHNSKAEIWKIIQDSIVKAGFIIAQVAILDKKQGTFKQVTSPGAVKNDLVINAYKPLKSFSDSFLKKVGLNMEKDFLEMHLHKLPIEPNVERTQQMLYSKILAQYIQNAFEVRMDASEFYDLLIDNFEERDGYWFNQDQISEYEQRSKLREKLGDGDINQTILGISDEKSAIIWLTQFLQVPRTYDDIFIEFSKNLLTSEDKIPEIKSILDENFATESGKYRLPSNLERKEKEEIRDKRLMKEFQEILQEAQSKRKIKEVRKEALLHGLMKLYHNKDVEQINHLGDRLNRNIIDSDDDISAIIDWAKYR